VKYLKTQLYALADERDDWAVFSAAGFARLYSRP
jgi:hypothetical protein